MARHQVGDIVRLWKPGHAGHGMQAVVYEVLPIEHYYGLDTDEGRANYGSATLRTGDQARGPHVYRPSHGWRDAQGRRVFGGSMPDVMVVSEEAYRRSAGDTDEDGAAVSGVVEGLSRASRRAGASCGAPGCGWVRSPDL